MKNLPEELLSAYLDGELTAQEQAQIERLLADSAEARQLLEELRLLSQSLQRLPVHKLKEDLAAQVLQEAKRRQAEAPAAAPSPPASLPTAMLPTPATTSPADSADYQADFPAGLADSAVGPANSAACPACRPIGPPTAEAKAGAGLPAAGELMSPSTWLGPARIRRLFTSRGVIWSAVAVLVAVAIWWFSPPARGPIRQVAQAPRHPAELPHPASPPGDLSEKAADRDFMLTEVHPTDTELEPAIAHRRGPTGAAIRARSDEDVPPTFREKALALAEPGETARSGMAPAGPKPSSDRADATDKPAPLALPEALSKGRDLPSAMAPGADGLAGRKTIATDRPAPDTLAKETKESTDAGPAQLAAKGSTGEMAGRSGLQKGSTPGAGAAATPSPAEPLALAAQGGNGRSKAAEPPPSGPPTGIAEAAAHPGPAMPEAPMAAGQPPTVSHTENRKGELLPENWKSAFRQVHALLPDTTLVVVCDVSTAALRQRTLEQILAENQILLAEGEEVLEEAAGDVELEPDTARKTRRADAVVSGPGKPAEAADRSKAAEADTNDKLEREQIASSVQPQGKPAEASAEEKPGASPSAAAPERLAVRAEQAAKKSLQSHPPTPAEQQPPTIANHPAARDPKGKQDQASLRQPPSIAHHPAGPDQRERRAIGAGMPGQSPPGLPAPDRALQTSEPSAMGQVPPSGAVGAAPAPESQLQFVLLEASPEQLEATLRAIQARSEDFLAVSISPSPSDPAQQIYQQYSRAYRAPSGPPVPAPAIAAGESEKLRQQRPPLAAQQPPSVGQQPPVGEQPPLAQQQAFGHQQELGQEQALGRQQPFAQQQVGQQQVGPERAVGPQAALGQQQVLPPQHAWARRLRLPEHLSQQLAFAQQAPFRYRKQTEADQQPPATHWQQTPAAQQEPAQPQRPPASLPHQQQPAPDRQQPAAAQPQPAPAQQPPVPAQQQPSGAQHPAPLARQEAGRETGGTGGVPLAPQAVQPIMGLAPQAGETSLPKLPPFPQRIRVLFVLRPAEPAG